MSKTGGGPAKRGSALNANNVGKYELIDLVKIVRTTRKKETIDIAFKEVERRMEKRMRQISFKFSIPGFSFSDVYQESLYALRYKAIKDYDETRGSEEGPYPFDRFAVLCIRRHLSTKLKASYQNKKRVLNSSISLDQERSDSNSEETMTLADIFPRQDGTVLESLGDSEYFRILFSHLISKLSPFERYVFMLYVHRFSYEEIAERINAKLKLDNSPDKINIKSVDNALSRIKNKAKVVFSKYGEPES
jgi:RNA polymerase sigma factor (sigma-70 family)